MRTIVETINTTNPGQDPVTGDILQITYSDQSTDRLEFVSTESEDLTEEPEQWIISVGSFLDRLDINGHLDTIYAMIEQGKQATPPDMTLFKYMSNLRQREYVDLQDPRLRPTIDAVGLYSDIELDQVFAPAQDYEVPIAVNEFLI